MDGKADSSKSRRRILLLAVGVPVITVVVGLYTISKSFFFLKSEAGRLQGLISEAREEGLAITSTELNEGVDSPPPLLAKAVSRTRALLVQGVQTVRLFDSKGDFASSANMSAAKSYEQVIDLMEQHLENEPARVGNDWVLQPQLPPYWSVTAEMTSRALCLRAYQSIKNGDIESGFKDLRTIEKLARRVNLWPGQEGTLCAGLCIRDRLTTIMMLANEQPNNIPLLERLRAEAAKGTDIPSPFPSIRGHVFENLNRLKNPELQAAMAATFSATPTAGPALRPSKTDPMQALVRGDMPKETARQAAMARYLTLALPTYRKIKNNKSSWTTAATEWDKVLDKARSDGTPTGRHLSLVQNPFHDIDPCARHQIKQTGALAMLDAILYRAKHGDWPTDISQLGTEVKDPFSQKPLKVAKHGGFFRVYSFGPDGIDGGGLIEAEALKVRKYSDDVVILFPSKGVP